MKPCLLAQLVAWRNAMAVPPADADEERCSGHGVEDMSDVSLFRTRRRMAATSSKREQWAAEQRAGGLLERVANLGRTL